VGREAGLVQDDRWEMFCRKREQKARLLAGLRNSRHEGWLKRPECKIEEIRSWVVEVLARSLSAVA